MARVLVADSQPLLTEELEALFSHDDGHHVLPELTRCMAPRDRTADSPLSCLSSHEREVSALLTCGWDNARIWRDLFIGQHTVRTHIQDILEKLGMYSKLEAATLAMQRSAELEPVPLGTGSDD